MLFPQVMSSEVVRKNPLEGHPSYEKIADLSSGSFGFVLKARKKWDSCEMPCVNSEAVGGTTRSML